MRIRPPQKLFELEAELIVHQANVSSYSPSPDGQRFRVNASAETGNLIVNVVTNW